MTDDQPDGNSMRDAARTGLRRAGFHLLKAGWEVLSGVEAFLDEMGKARAAAGDEDSVTDGETGPTRIPVE